MSTQARRSPDQPVRHAGTGPAQPVRVGQHRRRASIEPIAGLPQRKPDRVPIVLDGFEDRADLPLLAGRYRCVCGLGRDECRRQRGEENGRRPSDSAHKDTNRLVGCRSADHHVPPVVDHDGRREQRSRARPRARRDGLAGRFLPRAARRSKDGCRGGVPRELGRGSGVGTGDQGGEPRARRDSRVSSLSRRTERREHAVPDHR